MRHPCEHDPSCIDKVLSEFVVPMRVVVALPNQVACRDTTPPLTCRNSQACVNGKSISVNGRFALQARNMLLRVELLFHVPLLALPPAEGSQIIILSERATSMVECAPSVEVMMGEVNYSIILGRPLTDSPRNSPLGEEQHLQPLTADMDTHGRSRSIRL
jgi:hypothetical protein